MKKINFFSACLVLLSLICFSNCQPVSCPPFQSSYTLGPYTSDGDKTVMENDLQSYLKANIPTSTCPAPSSNPTAPQTSQIIKCDPFPFNSGAPTNDCLRKEFEINNQTGGSGSLNDQYPATIKTDCEMLIIANDIMQQIVNGYFCPCQSTYASIVTDDIDVKIIFTANSGNPALPVKRGIYVNVTYRCCGPCR